MVLQERVEVLDQSIGGIKFLALKSVGEDLVL